MNFLCMGFFILSIQLNFSWTINYILKLIGMLFLIIGVKEMSEYHGAYKQLMKLVRIISDITGAAFIAIFILNFLNISGALMNVLGLIIGAVVTAAVILPQKKIIDMLWADDNVVNDTVGVKLLKSAWTKLIYFTFAGLVCNVFNIIPVKAVADTAGLAMAVCRIIMYIFALVMLWRFNKVRSDFYKKNK